MDVRELRIGNWFINHEAEPETTIYWQVESIERASNSPNQKHLGVRFRSGSCWANASIIEPIPLTEEWLVKFGFDWIEEDRVWTLTVCPQGSFSITFTYQEDFSLALSESPQMIDETCPAMRLFYNVHQLQNLYFALTGEELQIKDHD